MSEKTKNVNNGIQSSNEGYQPLARNIGYQSQTNEGQRGYQPTNKNFGYQPKKQSSPIPAPSTSSSNVSRPKHNITNNK